MSFRSFIFKFLVSRKLTIKILDNIFYFSSVNLEDYLKSMSKPRRLNSIRSSFLSLGIGYRNHDPLKAEKWFIENVLCQLYADKREAVFLDIGANVGDLSFLLKYYLPHSLIYSFEPNPYTFRILSEKFKERDNVRIFNYGFSSVEKNATLYSYEEDTTSGHASLLKEVFTDLYKANSIIEFQIFLKTLDGFCKEFDLEMIDYIKIDTEGFEFDILQGGADIIGANKISLIQFEFNEMNIINRIFLKDFYELLKNYKFFRISDGELIDISEYKSEYEIFWYQDILCVLRSNESLLKEISKYLLK